MATLTLISEELKAFPPLERDIETYKSVIMGNSPKTVCEYLLDLRTFFRYTEAKRLGIDPADPAFTEIRIDHIDLDYIASITAADIYEFLLYAAGGRKNGWAARSRKLSA